MSLSAAPAGCSVSVPVGMTARGEGRGMRTLLSGSASLGALGSMPLPTQPSSSASACGPSLLPADVGRDRWVLGAQHVVNTKLETHDGQWW